MNITSQIIVTAVRGKPASQVRQLTNTTQPHKIVVSSAKPSKGHEKEAMSHMGGEKVPLRAAHNRRKESCTAAEIPILFVPTIFVSKLF